MFLFFVFQFCDEVTQVVINVFFSEILPKNDHEKKEKATTSLKGKKILKRRLSPYGDFLKSDIASLITQI
jgi:hypothetical protein